MRRGFQEARQGPHDCFETEHVTLQVVRAQFGQPLKNFPTAAIKPLQP